MLATWPIHVQLFAALGWKCPKYCHTAHLMKAEGSGKRKLSKRKDPELALSFYRENGYPSESVREYLMTLLNSNFEEWRLANPKADIDAFPFALSKMGVSGALFDLDKLRDVSKNVVAAMTAQQVYDAVATGRANTTGRFTSCWPPTPPMRSVSCPSAAAAKSRARTSRSGRTSSRI